MSNVATVGFVYNYPCPLKCDFCCHTLENVGPGRLTPASVTPLLIAFGRQPSVTRFAFTGGDPFIYWKEIRQIMADARQAEVEQPYHIVTSAFWAKTAAATRSRLEALHAVGLDKLYVSYDRQHARWVPADYVYRVADVCSHLDIKLTVYGVFWDQEDRIENLLGPIDGVSFHSDLVVRIGRATDGYGNRPRYALPEESKSSCGGPRNYDITIYPNGDVYPCCSGGFNKQARLECGNVFSDSASSIVRRVYGHFHARIAKEIGFSELYSRIKEVDPEMYRELTPFSDVDSVCELCRDLHSNPILMERLRPLYERLEREYALARVDDLIGGRQLVVGESEKS